jgi:hypothetical protein
MTGGLSLYLQFKQIKEWNIFLDDFLLATISLLLTSLLTIILIFTSVRHFRQHRNLFVFVPVIAGISIISVVLGHRLYREAINNHKSILQAMNYTIGSDGGFTFDFKEGGYLQGKKVDRLSTTYYWGSYIQKQDTFLLNIPLDFKLGRRAYFQNNTLYFQDDTIKFSVLIRE